MRWREGSTGDRPATIPLGLLKRELLTVGPGQKIGYVTDVAFSDRNVEKIVALVKDADLLFIEAPFVKADAALAADRWHLTTDQAGTIARLAGAKRVEPFHFSPRYDGEEAQLRCEVEEAFRSGRAVVADEA